MKFVRYIPLPPSRVASAKQDGLEHVLGVAVPQTEYVLPVQHAFIEADLARLLDWADAPIDNVAWLLSYRALGLRTIAGLPIRWDAAVKPFAKKLSQVELLPPVKNIPSFRDFYAFEAHVKNARKKRGLEMVPEWYDAPVFYFSNTASIVGNGAKIQKPTETRELDYELEWAVVIGKEGGNIAVADADNYIQGFTILNDWSMRDVQRHEMKVGLGPAKGKDFATSVGPFLVTPDELEDRVLEDRSRGKRYDLEMAVFVNGVRRGGGNTRDMNWTFAELIAAASRNTVLKPGDLIGSGTVGTGCITEFTEGIWPWLEVGDVVRLEVERLGALENTIV